MCKRRPLLSKHLGKICINTLYLLFGPLTIFITSKMAYQTISQSQLVNMKIETTYSGKLFKYNQ